MRQNSNLDEEEKLKYVKGFKNCSLTLREYSNKMRLDPIELKEWLKKYDEKSQVFGRIDLERVLGTNIENEIPNKSEKSNTTKSIAPVKFENATIKIELKENYDKELLKHLIEVLVLC